MQLGDDLHFIFRNCFLEKIVVKVQSMGRCYVARKKFIRMRLATLCIQVGFFRASAPIIFIYFWRYYLKKQYQWVWYLESKNNCQVATRVQTFWRGFKARSFVTARILSLSAIVIQVCRIWTTVEKNWIPSEIILHCQ